MCVCGVENPKVVVKSARDELEREESHSRSLSRVDEIVRVVRATCLGNIN